MKETETLRVPPNAADAEIGVLGCLLLDPITSSATAVGEYGLTHAAFYNPVHQALFEIVLSMIDEQKHVDLLTFARRLRDLCRLDELGGDAYLQVIIDRTPTATACAAYCQIVKAKWIARQTLDTAQRIAEEAYRTDDPDALLRQAPDRFMKIMAAGEQKNENDGEVMDIIIREWEDARKHQKPAIDLHMPWPKLTEQMQGLEIGVTIVAGRPSAGKTTLEGLISTFQCMSAEPIPVARVTADSTRKQLLQRQLCNLSGVSMAKLKFGFARNDQLDKVREAREQIRGMPQWINDRDLEVLQICAWARFMKARHGIRLLTVDYIQQLRASHLGGRAAVDPVTKTTEISSRFKALSYELGIPVLVLSQLNRAVDKDGREPQLSDLRDSGAIEQDAQKVLILWVDGRKKSEMESSDPEATKHKRPVWLGILKNKDGGTGKLPFWLYPPYFKFDPAATPLKPGEPWTPFSDDKMPSDAAEESDRWERAPELIPHDEATDEDEDERDA